MYYDYHKFGTAAENRVHFDHIKTTILNNIALRGHPLTLLIENGCNDEHAFLTRKIDEKISPASFLEKFDNVIGKKMPSNVSVKSIETRNVIFLIDTWVGEWCHNERRLDMPFLVDLKKALLPYSFKFIRQTALAKMKVMCRGVVGTSLEGFFNAKIKQLLENWDIFKASFCDNCGVSFSDFDNKPIVSFFSDCRHPMFSKYLSFVGADSDEAETSNFFAGELLAPLVDATLVHEAVNAGSNVGVFAGGLHCEALSLVLHDLGYVQEDRELEAYDKMMRDDVEPDGLVLVPLKFYDWMK